MVYVPKASVRAASPLTQPTSYPTRVVAGHTMVNLPGGSFVEGSAKYDEEYWRWLPGSNHPPPPHSLHAPPRWVRLSPFSAGISPVAESQLRAVMVDGINLGGNPQSTPDMPATCVSWDQAVAYCVMMNVTQKTTIGLLTDAEGEYAGRGPAVDLRAVMIAEGIHVADFAKFVDERYENFVTAIEPGARIFTDATDTELQCLLETDKPLYAWCMYAPAGRLSKETAWYDRGVVLPSVDWGPANGFGVKLATGGVKEWRADSAYECRRGTQSIEDPLQLTHDQWSRSVRGGERWWGDTVHLRLADRDSLNHGRGHDDLGFRVGAPQDSPA